MRRVTHHSSLVQCLCSLTIVSLLGVSTAQAACPNNARFRFFDDPDQHTISVSDNQHDQSFDSGSVISAAMPIDDVVFDLNITPGAHGIDTHFNITDIRPRIWRLRVSIFSGLQISDLDVTYDVVDGNGFSGYVSSVNNPSSQVPVTVEQRNITRRLRGLSIIFKGFVNLNGDFANARYSGAYTGEIVTTIECN